MQCANCPKNAMYWVGPEKGGAPLCLDCYIRLKDVSLRELEIHEREINFLTSHMESLVGLPGFLPRYPERRPIVHTGAVNLNNIQISNSQIGVLNTGTIESVNATVNVLRSEGSVELANAVVALIQSLIASTELADAAKNQVIELLGSVAEEAVVPKERRKSSVARALITEISGVLSGVGALAGLWEKVKTILEQVLG